MYQLYHIMIPKISQISLEGSWDINLPITYSPYSEIFLGKISVTFAYQLCPIIILLKFQKDHLSESWY